MDKSGKPRVKKIPGVMSYKWLGRYGYKNGLYDVSNDIILWTNTINETDFYLIITTDMINVLTMAKNNPTGLTLDPDINGYRAFDDNNIDGPYYVKNKGPLVGDNINAIQLYQLNYPYYEQPVSFSIDYIKRQPKNTRKNRANEQPLGILAGQIMNIQPVDSPVLNQPVIPSIVQQPNILPNPLPISNENQSLSILSNDCWTNTVSPNYNQCKMIDQLVDTPQATITILYKNGASYGNRKISVVRPNMERFIYSSNYMVDDKPFKSEDNNKFLLKHHIIIPDAELWGMLFKQIPSNHTKKFVIREITNKKYDNNMFEYDPSGKGIDITNSNVDGPYHKDIVGRKTHIFELGPNITNQILLYIEDIPGKFRTPIIISKILNDATA
jgi:hypothetical protein